jgi:diketogulonate reductase-like aldo/keto reductase
MKTVTLPTDTIVPALGLGTWRMGEDSRTRARETAAVRFALDIGYRLIDTAEMYGDGGAEEVVGAAVVDAVASRVVRREDLFIVSKVYPHHASRKGVVDAFDGLAAGKRVIGPGAPNRVAAVVNHHLPRRLLLPMVARNHPGMKRG